MNSSEESQLAFEHLIKNESFLPDWFKKGIENGLLGNPMFTSKQIEELTRLEIFDIIEDTKKLAELGFFPSTDDFENLKKTFWCADDLINKTIRCNYGWGLPTEESISKIVNFLEVNNLPGLLEIGAGSGLWSGIISARTDKDIVACDLNLRSDTPLPKYYPVLNEDGISMLKKYSNYATLLVWTDTNNIGLDILENMENNQNLILIGPISVTANKKFYETLDAKFSIRQEFIAHSFSGSFDAAYILTKNETCDLTNNFFTNKFIEGRPKISLKFKK